ncbi:MAG: tRNA lysidine(34) synthetase TilS [Bacteroidetes bacterium]|nr:MAG: tRNA lysidine(34) synthetase TilS [Bacteroidota bacterium]REK33282.1 MAG: tRNA lysidine(34) synthetase TilS [Bacteroidota bacterium]REK49682.1 MAG: tRNA lysidine(34) synthetase TilS [Bacteroidota bacterium]
MNKELSYTDLNILDKSKSYLLAFSGGLDSVVLFHILIEGGYKFSAVHCNFTLRGKESDDDEFFVKHICKSAGIRCFTKRFDTAKINSKSGKSIQETARELRYKWFEELRKKYKFDSILTAHHLNDKIETFFINLIRGTGLKGLTGMPKHRDNIIRPMIDFKRSDLLAYAKKNKLEWREDSSNAKSDYLRNKLRIKIIPELAALREGFEGRMKSNIENLHSSELVLEDLLKEKLSQITLESKGGRRVIDMIRLRDEKHPEELLAAIMHSIGIQANLAKSLLEHDGSGKLFYSGKFRLLRDRNKIIIEKQSDGKLSGIKVKKVTREISLGSQSLRFEFKEWNRTKIKADDSKIQILDAGRLKFPLLIRPWQAGDAFVPLGMKQKKKVSDYLTDKKIDLFCKENCHLLLSGRDIVCILGHRIDDRYKVSDHTKTTYIIRLQNGNE